LPYDTLLYALGSAPADHGVPSVAEHADELASRPGALRLRERLAGLGAGGRVVAVGGGPTGIEAVTEIAEARPDLDGALAARGGLGDSLSAGGGGHVRGGGDGLGVGVDERTDVAAVRAGAVETGDGAVLPADVTVWATGFATHPLAAAAGLEVTREGRIVVDGTMRSVSHPEVY